jgi:hypothetical protein
MAETLTYRAFKAFSGDELARLQNDYKAQEQAIQQQIAQATQTAQQQARSYFDGALSNTANQILQQNKPEIDKYRSTINQIQAFRDGRTNKINIISPHGGREIWERENFGPGSEWVVDQALEIFNRDINNLSNPEVLRKQALERLVDQSPSYGPYGFNSMVFQLTGQPIVTDDAYKRVEQVLRDDLFQVAYPQAEAYYVQPLLGQLSTVQDTFNRNYENAVQSYERKAEQAVDSWYDYLDSRKGEVDRQVADVYKRDGFYSPEATALLKAYEDEKNFLRGPEFNFGQNDYQRAKSAFDQSFTQIMQNTAQPAPAPEVQTPTPQVTAPPAPPAPTLPSANVPTTQNVAAALTPPVAPVTTPPAVTTPPSLFTQAPADVQPVAPVTQPTVTQPTVTQPVTPVTPVAPVPPQVTTPPSLFTQAPTQPTTTQPTTAQTTTTQPPVPISMSQMQGLIPPSFAMPTMQTQQQMPTMGSFMGGIPVGLGTQAAQPTGNIPMATTPLSAQNLPELRSSGGGGTSAIDPTLRPYLELGLRAAEQQFLQTQPQFFPGQTYVSPSQQTLDALAAQEQIARTAPGTLQAAQESYMRGLGGLGATAQGAFLTGNPFQLSAIEAATRPIMQQYQEQTLPGIASGFSAAGRYGSGAMERAQGRAAEATGRAIGDVASNIAYSGYEAERGRQQQALTQQINAAQMAPQIYGQQFLPSQQLAQIGAAREAISAQPLQEQMARFQFAQQAPVQQLQSFLSSVYGTPMAGSQYAPTPVSQTNRAGNVLGLAATGAGIGSMIGGNLGGYSSTAIGAGLGALGGLLS